MVFITGFGGRFPASDSLKHFWSNLCEGVDLVTHCGPRYPEGYHGLPPRQGQIKTIKKFDAMFFGVSAAQSACLDPQIRLLLESVFEAITDAGYTMADLAGSETGVYVGGCFSDLHKSLLTDLRLITGYENTGCSHSMFANRVSFYFDFKGPSYTVDTACSSSLVAFDHAVRDLRAGRITRAIVGGVSCVTDPAVSKAFQMYNMLSPTGKCHSFDDRADGYVRADAIGSVLLELGDVCNNRGILRVLGTGCNSDGWKAKGITFPSSDQQASLYRKVMKEYGLEDANLVEYIEAHGTGTVAGDGVELKGIDAVFGPCRKALVGSVKSNMGHSEGASGMMSLIKVCGIMNDRTIPTNLHYQSTHHEPLVDKRLTVVDSTRPFNGGRIVINNFGFGGTNANLVCEPGNGVTNSDESYTRFIFGRNKSALEAYVQDKDLNNAAWKKFMRNSSMSNKFPWRGVVTQKVSESGEVSVSLNASEIPSARVPIAFCYSGQGCQWKQMGKDLFAENEVFRNTVREATTDIPLASEHNTSIDELFQSGEMWMDKKWSGLGITLVQLGLTAVLKDAGVVPDYIFGHSVGEVACGFADGCTSAREAARIAYVRCQFSSKVKADGLMLAAGLSYEQAKEVITQFKDTVIACNNSPDGVTLSGDAEEIKTVINALEAQGVFAKVVPTDGIAYHSLFFKRNADKIHSILDEVITDSPKIPRSAKWLATSQAADETPYADAAYHAGNVIGMVNFAPVAASLPAGTLVIEVGPHALLKSIIKRCNPGVSILGTMNRGGSGVENVRSCIDSAWLAGCHLDFPKCDYLVPLKNKIAVRWDHENDWRVAYYKDFQKGKSTVVTYDLANKDSYLMDHVIDGRPLFPATGHIVSAWQAYNNCTKEIYFTNVKILSAVIMDGVSISFTVTAEEKAFTIVHDGNLVATGNVSAVPLEGPKFKAPKYNVNDEFIAKQPIYSYFARFGYEYKPNFQLIATRSVDGKVYNFLPTEHWIPYLDNMLQAFLRDPSGLNLPTEIGAVAIRCPNVADAGDTVYTNLNLHAVGNDVVSIRDLKTTPSRKIHKPSHMRGVEFVAYGEHSSNVVDVVTEDTAKSPISEFQRKGLSIIAQIIRENTCKSQFSLLELATSSIDELSNDLHPFVAPDMFGYKVSRRAKGDKPVSDEESPLRPTAGIEYGGEYELLGTRDKTNTTDVLIFSRSLSKACSNASEVIKSVSNDVSAEDTGFVVVFEDITDDDSSFKWIEAIKSADFEVITWYIDVVKKTILILAKKLAISDSPYSLVEPIISTRQETKPDTRQLFVTNDFGYYAFVRSLRKEPNHGGLRIAFFDGAVDESKARKSNLAIHAYVSGVFGGFHEIPLAMKPNQGSEKGYHVEVTNPGDMTSLCWIENHTENASTGVISGDPNCVVHYCGINFKDVMLSYGKLQSEGAVKIGLEFTGKSVADNRNVMGISAGCMATKVYAPSHLLWNVPDHLTLESACTIPVVYATVYYALVCKAQIKAGQTILVHSIAGGVGQAAYHVCKYRGCTVIATCSKDKRDWVHSTFQIPHSHILDSHSTQFRDDVFELTDGRGVDVVLNSLSDAKLHASISCIAKYGHFCEIGKYDIQQNTAIGLGIFERNISFHAFDLGDMFNKPQLWQPIRDLITEGLVNGEIKPLCTTVYDAIEPALRCISGGKHIGKVLVRVQQESPDSLYTDAAISKIAKPYFRTSGTHIVVGGLGGFGLEMVNWLWNRGAEKIIIISRGNAKPHQYHLLKSATIDHSDLADAGQCEALLKSIGSSLVGVWHLGMVLNDRLYSNMTDAAWDETVRVKADICRNLDTFSRVHNKNLAHFMLWSSVSSLFGNPGQTNYAYANACEEKICMDRAADGLSGSIAVQWGFIGNVGVLSSESGKANSTLAFVHQHIDSCLESVHTAIYCNHAVMSSYVRRTNEASGPATSGSVSLPARIARVLGIEISKIKETDTLASLGMDSLQSVEVTNILKAAGVYKKVVDLRSTTWQQITAM